ncbi:MAG: hypothetical protein E7092_00620 [Bacteroidales bacterium]|nr:hypothetical protein [Bacteroidales bacterium]
MKKLFVTLIALFSIGTFVAVADNDRIIAKESLPRIAQQFISSYFGDVNITYVKEEHGFFEKSYEVVFADGTKVEFARNGEWKEIDCRRSSVPSPIIPDKILKYVKNNYPDAKILQIERDRNDYEVRLSNRLELTFDKAFNIIDIDD